MWKGDGDNDVGGFNFVERKREWNSLKNDEKNVKRIRHDSTCSSSSTTSTRNNGELLSPESPPPSALAPPTPPTLPPPRGPLQCLLCMKSQFKNDMDFLIHLTIIHFKDRIMKRVKVPYKCLKCGYVPDNSPDAADDLLMHYGCQEKFALTYYDQEIGKLPRDQLEQIPESSAKLCITCELCNTSFENERLFMRHISLRHFTKELCDDLPKKPPFICPFIDCKKSKSNLHNLMLHYGCEHNLSMDLYLKQHGNKGISIIEPPVHPPPASSSSSSSSSSSINNDNKDGIPKKSKGRLKEVDLFTNQKDEYYCKLCPKKQNRSFITQKSLNYHLMMTHFFPDLPISGPYNCPKCNFNYLDRAPFAKHFLQVHLEEYLRDSNIKSSNETSNSTTDGVQQQTPINKFMTTTHKRPPTSEARARLNKNWESNSVDGQKKKIEELEAKIKEMEDEHKESLKKRSEDFEKWITQKEAALEEEELKRKNVEDNLERTSMDLIEVRKQLEKSQDNQKNLEQMLVEKHSLNHEVMKNKKALEKKVVIQDSENQSLNETITGLEKSLLDLKTEYDLKVMDIENLNTVINVKDEEMKELVCDHNKEKAEIKKSLSKSDKALISTVAKLDKANEDKKNKANTIRDLNKKLKEAEHETKNNIAKFKKEKDALTNSLNKYEKNAKKDSLKDQSKIDDFEKRIKESNETNEVLEAERNSLLDSLERIQRIMRDYETVLQEKNEIIKDMKTKLKESEFNYEEASKKIINAKTTEKEKRELNREIKCLQNTLKDFESRQISNMNLVKGLERKKSQLETKVAEYEENIGTLEELNSEFRADVENKLDQVKRLKKVNDNYETESAKMKSLLQRRNEELASLNIKVGESDKKMKIMEKELRSNSSNNLEIDSLNKDLMNRTMEITHLKVNLSQLNKQLNKYKQENHDLVLSLRHSQCANERFEMEYSKKIAELETMKNTAKESVYKVNKKDAQIKKMKDRQSKNIERIQNIIDDSQSTIATTSSTSSPSTSSTTTNTNTIVTRIMNEFNEMNSSLHIKEEPIDTHDQETNYINASKPSIELNINATVKTEIINPKNDSLITPEEETSSSSTNSNKKPQMICFNPVIETSPQLSPYRENPYDIFNFHDEEPESSSSKGPTNSNNNNLNKNKGAMEDVTGQIDESDDVVCGICNEYDPPLPSDAPRSQSYQTQWVGCDCDRWYHKICTGLSKFSTRFSCKSVKKRCIKKVEK